MKKQLLSLICCISLAGCASPAQNNSSGHSNVAPSKTENKEFADYLEQEFIDSVTMDYMNFHQYVSNPKEYDIKEKEIEVTYGDVLPSEKDIKEFKESKEKLESFDYGSLDETQQVVYDMLEYNMSLQDKQLDKKFRYLDNIWSSSGNPVSDLTNYYSSIYILYREEDIKDLVTLINDTPRYADEIIKYTKKQAEKGLLAMNYDAVMSSVDAALNSAGNSEVYTSLYAQVDALGLSEEKAQKAKDDIKKALDESFYPSFDKIKKELEGLKDQIKPYSGMASRKNGREYYELILKNNTGTTKTPDQIREEMVKEFTKKLTTMMETENEPQITTPFQSPQEVLEFMTEHYTKHYPEIKVPEYNIQNLPDEQCAPSIVAYYVPTPLDGDYVNQMRFNARDHGSETTSVDFFTTFCHEGMPGHMYQHNFNKENLKYAVQNIYDNLAFSEGYAVYVQNRSLYDLPDVSKKDVDTYIDLEALNNYIICIMDIDINYGGLSLEEFKEQYGELFGEDAVQSIYEQLCDIPGTFLAYYYGCYRMQSLRQLAEDELDDDFDEVAFHKALLQYGSVNFEIAEENIEAFIDAQQ